MQKIKDYVDRFFKSKEKNYNYTLSSVEMVEFAKGIQSGQPEGINSLFDIIFLLFNYGYAKGYRAASVEMKKNGTTHQKTSGTTEA